MLNKNFGLTIKLIAGISIKEHVIHKKIEKMIRNAKDLIIGKDDKSNTENPNITDTALIVIPLPVFNMAFFTAFSGVEY